MSPQTVLRSSVPVWPVTGEGRSSGGVESGARVDSQSPGGGVRRRHRHVVHVPTRFVVLPVVPVPVLVVAPDLVEDGPSPALSPAGTTRVDVSLDSVSSVPRVSRTPARREVPGAPEARE